MADPSLDSMHEVLLHGRRVAFRRMGAGPVLLLIHGMAGSSRTWEPVLPLLTDRFTVIAPDLPGHGRSDPAQGDYSLGAYASVLRDLLAVLELDRATIVGHSLGGGIAMQFAYQYPERCDRLVLVDSGGLGREVSWLLRAMALPGAELTMPVLFPGFAREWGGAVERFFRARGIRWARASESWRAYASLTGPENRRAFVHTVRAVIDPGGQSVSAVDRLYLTSEIPTLIIWGDQDRIIPLAHAHAAHQAMPGSRLAIIEGTGHFPQAEEPARFARIVAEFVDETEPSTADRARLVAVMRARASSAATSGPPAGEEPPGPGAPDPDRPPSA
jgi:pimeloyl-ACP methyl ester carboxylesterase